MNISQLAELLNKLIMMCPSNSPEDLPEAMNDREKWRERVRDICATSTT